MSVDSEQQIFFEKLFTAISFYSQSFCQKSAWRRNILSYFVLLKMSDLGNASRVRQIPFFFLENALKKTTEYFLKFLFYLKVQSFRLIMENNFIQMAASAGHAVACNAQFLSTLSNMCRFHQWLHEYCPLKRQLSLACPRNT